MKINKLDKIAVVGVGLLGGSIGHALRAAGFNGRRVGIGRRASSLERALKFEAVDEVSTDIAAGVADVQMVILCTPIGQFERLIGQMSDSLQPGCYVTDVASTKSEVVRLAQKQLPKQVHFVGAHPMAGSEKTGVEYARADLFENALCIVTPSAKTPAADVKFVSQFWETLGCHSLMMSPQKHDRLLARVSHLPHAVATALVHLAMKQSAIDLAGPGFADSTRIASGSPEMWVDIFQTNRKATMQAIDQLVAELTRFRDRLEREDLKAIEKWLAGGKDARDQWITERFRKKVL